MLLSVRQNSKQLIYVTFGFLSFKPRCYTKISIAGKSRNNTLKKIIFSFLMKGSLEGGKSKNIDWQLFMLQAH